ncbi:PilZ domain-containing protein [Devosia sp. YIM 151766]|uniref:PilZ domain-containing protein n=1 Tax=Devosia sp. YIM 151766 TaxID=3017325 RepID=UPI00255C3DF2|nr:PilZ domain-containing protein [Devosia sp. YIM 151766]WIY53478.1 PilZ domain-containing protein [Devosia sp. YIM 151766]
MTEDNRGSRRQRTLKGGKIVFNDGFSTFDCTIRNISDGGAKLLVASLVGIPQRFQLALDDGRRFECEMTWHHDGEIGVKFL